VTAVVRAAAPDGVLHPLTDLTGEDRVALRPGTPGVPEHRLDPVILHRPCGTDAGHEPVDVSGRAVASPGASRRTSSTGWPSCRCAGLIDGR
jgi:hypothetical protein